MNQTTIGERIKYHRKRLGMTQEQLAERIGVSAQAVSKWENNLSCPDISILPELAALFGITVDELLGKNEPVHEAEPIGKDKGVEFNVSLGKGKKHGLLFAIYVIVFGALLLVNMLLPNPPSWWTVLWTTFLIYVGISSLCEQFSVFGTAATVIGLIFFVNAYHALPLPPHRLEDHHSGLPCALGRQYALRSLYQKEPQIPRAPEAQGQGNAPRIQLL